MKKITLMIVVSLMSFFAQAQLALEQFDAPWTGSPAAPPQWTVINQYGPINTWVQTTPGNTAQPPYGGTGHSAYLQKENVAPAAAIPSDWLVTKPFPVQANSELKFQSRLTIGQDQGGIYKIYIMASSNLPTYANFTTVGTALVTYDEITLGTVTQVEWIEKTLTIPAVWAGQNVYMAFVMEGDDKDRWFIDDVKVSAVCVPLTNPVASATTTTTATLTWNNPGANSWEVEVVLDSASPTGVGQVYNGALPYVKSGLLACTNYKYYVRTLCADGGISPWAGPVFFKTKCVGETCADPIVLPGGNQSVTGNTATYGDFYEGISGTGCNSTGNYLAGNDVVYAYTATATGNYSVVLNNTGGAAGMFIYSSCANIGIACIGGGVASATVPVNLPAFPMTAGTTYYIVISTNGTPQTTNYTLTIQQVFCPQPTAGTATAVTGSTATLAWTPGTVGATSWQLAVQPAGSGLPGANTTVSTNTGTIVGTTSAGAALSAATAYEFYVRESCAGGTFSIWAGPFLFTTTQVPSPMPYVQNFDGGPSGVTVANGTQVNKWAVGTATNLSPTKSLYVTNDDGISNNYNVTATSVVHAYKDIQMPAAIGQVALSFDWKAFGESCCDYLRVYVAPATFTPTPGTQMTAAADRIQFGGNMNLGTNWANFMEIKTAPAAWNGQVVRLIFEWRNDNSVGTTPPAAVDNINFSIVTCPQPTALTIASLTPTTANISWTAPAIVPPTYDVYVSSTNTAPTGATTPTYTNIPGTSTSFPIVTDGVYYVWVRAHCSGTDQSFWTGPVNFNTPQANPASLDYSENFDGPAHNYTLTNGTQSNKWVVGTATFNSAANSLYISNNNGTTNGYDAAQGSIVHAYRDITLPATIPSGQVLVQYDWKMVGNTGDFLRVWAVPTTFTPTPGTAITAVANQRVKVGNDTFGSATWTTSNTVITVPAAWNSTTVRLVFEWTNNTFTENQPPAAIDNVIVKVVTCPAPTALVLGSPLTTSSAVVNWTAPASPPASYDYYFSTSATPPTATTTPTGNVLGTTATVSPLTDSTSYNVWVRSNCGGAAGNSFWVGPLNFTTPQIPAPMPYSQNFDGAASNYALNNGTQANKWVVGGAVFNSPANSLYISNDNGVTNNYNDTQLSVVQAYRDIQMPASIPSNQVLLQFDWKAAGEACCDYLRVYVVPASFTPTPGVQMTNPAGGVQILGNLNNNNTWSTVNTVLNSSAWPAGSIRRVIFEWRNDGSIGPSPGAAIDNINMSVITCPAPTALVLGTPLTSTSAVVNWTPPTAAPASYDYYYSTSATAPTAATTPSGNVLTPTATLSPLTDSTNYNVWVRSNCGGTDGTSFWVGPLNFNTPQIPAPMPYSQNFDGGPASYTMNNGTQTNKWVVGGATFNSPANSLYISNDNGVTTNYTDTQLSVVQAYRDIQMPASIPTNQVLLQFDWKAAGEACCDYLRVYVVPVSFTPTPGTQMTTPAGGIQILGNLNNNNTWTTVNTVLNSSAWPPGTARRIIFEWRNDGSIGPSPGAAIDNINMSVITCSAPSALTAGTIDAAGATFTWTASTPPAASYDYYLTTSPVAPVAGTVPTGNVVGTTLTLTGLPDSANYYLWIRSNCGGTDGTSYWIGGVNFNTPQIAAPLPYTQNFDAPGNPGFSYTSGTQANKWVVGGATFNSPSTALYISNDNGVTNNYSITAGSIVHAYRDVVIPPGATSLDFSFDWKNVGEVNDYVRVWKVPVNFNPTAGTAITALAGQRELVTTANLFNGSAWQNASYAPAVTASTTQRFVFEWVNNTFTGTSPAAAIDNIDIKVMTCPKPTNLTATNIGMTSATLGWTEAGTATAWEVYVVEQGEAAPGTATVGTPAPTNPFVYNINMEPATYYQYYVRSVCAPGDKSRWSGPYAFHTNVCEVVDQCTMNFILTDSGNNGWGAGVTMTVSQLGIPVGVLGPQITNGGPVTVAFTMCKGLPYEVFFNEGNTANGAQAGLQIVNPFNNQTVFQRIAGVVASDMNSLIYTGIPYCSLLTCPQPTDLLSSNVVNAPTSTEFNWSPGGTETQWELIIQEEGDGFPLVTTPITVTVNAVPGEEPSYILTNVPTGVPFEYYVRAVCAPGSTSFWSGPLKYSLFSPPACANVEVVDENDVIIVPDTEYYVCSGDDVCVDFHASYFEGAAETSSYEITAIDYAPPFPPVGGTSTPVTGDDVWSPKVNLPFEFCFMGGIYNAVQISGNGAVSFNSSFPTGPTSPWSFNQTIPNAGFPITNAIFGVYQDTNPNDINNGWDHPNINYQVLGNYPCRTLVVSYDGLAQFNCSTDSPADQAIGEQSSQIVIYEVTNIIEVYVKRRVPCTGWQGGVGVIGLINSDGTQAFVPPGRNTGAWSANNEAWRFTPNGATSVNFEWLRRDDTTAGQDVFFSNDEDINVCATTTGDITMTARASYALCNGTFVTRDTQFVVRVQEVIITANDPVDITKCGNGEDVTFDLNVATEDVFADNSIYNFTFYPTEQDAIDQTNVIAAPDAFVVNTTTTVWVRIMKNGFPCFVTKSFDVIISNVPPVFGITPDASICDGTSATIAVIPDPTEDLSTATYTWTLDGAPLPDTTASITASVTGIYEVTVTKGGCVGTATSTITVVAMPVADAPADVTACKEYMLPALSADNNYYTATGGTGGTGTLISAGEVITSTQTIYVHAVSPALAACTDENSFVVTINVLPELDIIADVAACDTYELPVLTGGNAAANYYTGPGGTGTMLTAGDDITATQLIYVYQASAADCSAEVSFNVTVTTTPVADAPADVTQCDSYVLPTLSAGNNYFTGSGGTGTALFADDVISSTQLIFVYAVAAGNATCTDENTFTVNITPSPQFSLGGPYVACVASTVTVAVSDANFNLNDANYVWTVNGAAAGDNSSSIVATEFGEYEVTITVGDCTNRKSIMVSMDTSVIDLLFTDVCIDDVYTLEVSDVEDSFDPDTATYSWSGPAGFSSTLRTIVPVEIGEYVVTVTTADGCISIDSFEVISTACEIPRGISPNNDGMNDEFDLTSLDVKKIGIFNRYGQEVYSQNNYKKEWHGQGKGGDELPTGTYFYMIERSNGESITGWVYINRQD